MAAQRLRKAGEMLPMWYGKPGDQVLCFGVNARWWDTMTEKFWLETRIWDHECDRNIPSPWGWSLPVRDYYLDLGFTLGIPSDKDIEKIRELSHRRTAAALGTTLRETLPDMPLTEPAIEAKTIAEVEQAIAWHGGQVMVKFPWSSSGRGLANSRLMGIDKTLRMAQESISKQGSVMVEPLHERSLDFALLFECRGGDGCLCHGTSVFATDERGKYIGNMIASESDRRAEIGKHIDLGIIREVEQTIWKWLIKNVGPYYEGILGVDMMVTTDGKLDPCVELNLRKTMGWVAKRFSDDHLTPGVRGTLRVLPGEYRAAEAIVENHRMVAGELALTPANPYFTFLVKI